MWRPIAYLSKAINEIERNYEIYDWELLAIIEGLKQWWQYLIESNQFEIWTDHKNCKEAKLQAGIKPTALHSAIDKENSIEFSLIFLLLIHSTTVAMRLLSHGPYVTLVMWHTVTVTHDVTIHHTIVTLWQSHVILSRTPPCSCKSKKRKEKEKKYK